MKNNGNKFCAFTWATAQNSFRRIQSRQWHARNLHHDPTAPVVITSVMYHVGSKMKIRTNGFAHFLNTYF
jgi:hypothetical protein